MIKSASKIKYHGFRQHVFPAAVVWSLFSCCFFVTDASDSSRTVLGAKRTISMTGDITLSYNRDARTAHGFQHLPNFSAVQPSVLLVRGHNFSGPGLIRLSRMIWQCKADQTIPIIPWILLDITSAAQEKHKIIRFLSRSSQSRSAVQLRLKHGRDYFLYEYTSDDMKRRYPHLMEAATIWRNHSGASDNISLAYGFHTEATMLWYNSPLVKEQDPKFVWSIEYDVGFTGNIANVIHAYDSDPADLISKRPCQQPPSLWLHRFHVSNAYGKALKAQNRTAAPEFVQRFSKRLLAAVSVYTDLGMHAWSEQSICGYCTLAGLTSAALRKQHMGVPFSFFDRLYPDASAVHDVHTFSAMFSDSAKQNRFVHPLKF
eukprot:m.1480372 g.1480372  ORF g.1480372 m.1480372 type:complete len:373 (+) comp25171_c2_seq34:145-1263(+)